MANQLSPNKTKIIFAEYKDTQAVLDVERAALSKREGRTISEAEFLRTLTLAYANKRLKAQGKKPLDLDPASLPGGVEAAPRDRRPTSRKAAA